MVLNADDHCPSQSATIESIAGKRAVAPLRALGRTCPGLCDQQGTAGQARSKARDLVSPS